MKPILSKTLFLTLLVSCSLSEEFAINQGNDTAEELSIGTNTSESVTEVIHIPATTGADFERTDSQTEIMLVVVRRSKRRISPTDICGGILVSPRIVITAAHCFYDPHGLYRRFPEMFGVTYRREGGVFWDVKRNGLRANLLVAHAGYNENSRLNDIGAMRLERSVCEKCLLSIPRGFWRSDVDKLEMVVFVIENGHFSNIRTELIPARGTNKFTCDNAYLRWGIHINRRQICIDSLDQEFTHLGESAVLLMNNHPIGILSFKLDVSSTPDSLPYIYTDLTQYPAFIQHEIHNDADHPYRICSSILYVVISLGFVK